MTSLPPILPTLPQLPSREPPPAQPHLDHIPELDGIRGFAALMVLCHHLFFTSVPYPERWNRFVAVVSGLSHAGGYGVDLFFGLSGFLISSLLLLDRASPNFYRNFYWKRALRILPLYLTVLILLFAVAPSSWRYELLSLLFLANFDRLFHVAAGGPFWTLAIEEQFYLIWPRFARRLTLNGLERLARAVVLGCPALRLIAAVFGHSNYVFTFFHCDGLALGAMLACQQLRRQSQAPSSPAPRPRLLGSRLLRSRLLGSGLLRFGLLRVRPLLVLLAGLALTALPFAIPAGVPPDTTLACSARALQLSGIGLLCYCLIAAAIRRTGAPVFAIFRSRAFTFLGLVSYCLYLANGYVVIAYDRLRGPQPIGDMAQYAIRAAAVVSATLLICVVSRYAIELPAASLRGYVLRKP